MKTNLLIAAALMFAAPVAAQSLHSEGEAFLQAVRDLDANRAIPYLEAPGSRYASFKGVDGETALHIVTRAKEVRWVATLLHHGADPNDTDDKGDTPLVIATQLDFVDGAERLIDKGADVNLGNRWGETPLIIAVHLRKTRMVKLLLEKGADPDKPDRSTGLSARDHASRDTRNPEILQMIESVKPQGKLTFGPIIQR